MKRKNKIIKLKYLTILTVLASFYFSYFIIEKTTTYFIRKAGWGGFPASSLIILFSILFLGILNILIYLKLEDLEKQ